MLLDKYSFDPFFFVHVRVRVFSIQVLNYLLDSEGLKEMGWERKLTL